MPALTHSENERTWAALANASTLLTLVTPCIGGIIASLVIFLSFKEKSVWVAFHALQSSLFQLFMLAAILFIIGGSWAIGVILSFITTGFSASIAGPLLITSILFAGIILLAGMIYGMIAAFQVSQGRDFIFFWAGNWAARIMKLA